VVILSWDLQHCAYNKAVVILSWDMQHCAYSKAVVILNSNQSNITQH
jgi:hypothetical protein